MNNIENLLINNKLNEIKPNEFQLIYFSITNFLEERELENCMRKNEHLTNFYFIPTEIKKRKIIDWIIKENYPLVSLLLGLKNQIKDVSMQEKIIFIMRDIEYLIENQWQLFSNQLEKIELPIILLIKSEKSINIIDSYCNNLKNDKNDRLLNYSE